MKKVLKKKKKLLYKMLREIVTKIVHKVFYCLRQCYSPIQILWPVTLNIMLNFANGGKSVSHA